MHNIIDSKIWGVEDTEVKHVMTKNVITNNPSSSLLDVINSMNKERISRLLIVDGESVVGIVTARYHKVHILRCFGADVR